MPNHVAMEAIATDDLYEDRGSVPLTRPIVQGDVFQGIVLPGLSSEPLTVQIVAHPCAMRRKGSLIERITVAPVTEYQEVTGGGQKGWDGHLRRMPLSNLTGDGIHYAANFLDVTAAPSDQLTATSRIASLSNRGMLVLHQRLIKHYTRLTVDLPALRKEAAPTLEETEQQRDWAETVLGESSSMKDIEAEFRAYQSWLDEGSPTRRQLLEDEQHHRDIRRQARLAARARCT